MEKLKAGVEKVSKALYADGGHDAAKAIISCGSKPSWTGHRTIFQYIHSILSFYDITDTLHHNANPLNSGIANAGMGTKGMEQARQMSDWTAEALGIAKDDVVVASTGVIGMPLPMPVHLPKSQPYRLCWYPHLQKPC